MFRGLETTIEGKRIDNLELLPNLNTDSDEQEQSISFAVRTTDKTTLAKELSRLDVSFDQIRQMIDDDQAEIPITGELTLLQSFSSESVLTAEQIVCIKSSI